MTNHGRYASVRVAALALVACGGAPAAEHRLAPEDPARWYVLVDQVTTDSASEGVLRAGLSDGLVAAGQIRVAPRRGKVPDGLSGIDVDIQLEVVTNGAGVECTMEILIATYPDQKVFARVGGSATADVEAECVETLAAHLGRTKIPAALRSR